METMSPVNPKFEILESRVAESKAKTKKYSIKIKYVDDLGKKRTKTINIGQKGAEDFIMHKDAERRDKYDARHAPKEDWHYEGWTTAGFWAKHLLWSEPTLVDAVARINQLFDLKVVLE